ncbi:MAG: flagellar motor protein [Deltaproteobacteria bacterium]|nr:flagellar motor protein [Deltaproteobacteria bacterium]MCL4872472.1 flagellar motor protein [bacterium]
MDILTIIGLVLGFGAVLGGMVLEGGHLGSIAQVAAAVIVFGGTLGAVLVNYPLNVFVLALKNARLALFQKTSDPYAVIKLIAELSATARKDGLLALESSIKRVQDPFLRKGLQLVVDGAEPKLTREILEIDIAHTEEYNLTSAKVFESAGGYAPTIGIIGAVLGLIHVMENLSDPSKLGAGIAVAFVATVYGVASANLVYLPVAGKIKMKIREQVIMQEMAVEGLISLSEGENPRRVEEKLVGFLRESQRK